MVVREPTWVRFGPSTPIALGLPAMVWQPMQALVEKICCPRAALPVSPAVKLRPGGGGVAGTVYAGILSFGNTDGCAAAVVIISGVLDAVAVAGATAFAPYAAWVFSHAAHFANSSG